MRQPSRHSSGAPLHVLFITDNFPPEVNAPASRTFEHCSRWVQLGHQVTVITCAPNFPKGRVFEGYRNRLWQRETVNGIRVIRVWSYITANEGFLQRILDYVSFMVTGTIAGLFVRRPDVVVGTSPQFFAACAAWAIAAVKRRPFVFELRDLWPESIKAVGAMRQGTAIRILEIIELFLYRRAAAIISVTQSFKTTLTKRGIDPGKITVVTNGADIARYRPSPKDAGLEQQLSLQGKFVAGYIGTHGMAHALETVLEAAATLQAADATDGYRFIFLGDGARKADLQARAATANLRNVVFVDTVTKEEVSRYWSLLDVSVIHLRNTELFSGVIPSKLFECMAMGIPVAHGVSGESAQIVLSEDVGLVFESENAAALVGVLDQLRTDPALRARFAANGPVAAKRYSREALADRMIGVLATLKSPKQGL